MVTELPVVVGLGPVEASIVDPVFSGHARFVADPGPADLALAVGAIVRAHVTVDSELLDAMPKLTALARTGVGVEKVDVQQAHSRGIPVIITPGSNTTAVAEGTLAHLLALTKALPELTRLVRDNRWTERDGVQVGDLEGGTLAILGYGRIGRKVAQLAHAFGMNVVAYDPYVTDADVPLAASVEEALRSATHISCHLPATPETTGLINRSVIESLAPGTIIVNVARGEVLDLDAALWGLTAGILGGVGLDVFDQEPPQHHPIFDHPNVVLTPHVMGLTTASTAETFRQAALGILAVLAGRPPAHIALPPTPLNGEHHD